MFRLETSPSTACASCSNHLQVGCRTGVQIESDVVLSSASLAASHPVRACLLWPRRAFNRAVIAVYGLPMAGLVAGVFAAAGADGATEAAILVCAGVMLGLVAGWLMATEPVPQIVTLPDASTDFIHSEDPGTKR